MTKLSKFPVTMPDGTEYRVTIYDYIRYHEACVYVERKRSLFGLWRFKKVSTSRWASSNAPDDYVTTAEHAVRQYEDTLRKEAERLRRKIIFTEWDGRISEGSGTQSTN